jgi:hypothetical protein
MRRETQIGQIGRFTARTRDKVGDPFIKFHRIKAALIAAGLIDEAMAMEQQQQERRTSDQRFKPLPEW